MPNNLDKQYLDLLQDIMDNGVKKEDRTGTGTLSVFGRQIRHRMSDGFPILTTKKVAFKTMVVELIWFMKGHTNIKYLLDNNCHIWDGDAYKSFKNSFPIKKSNPPKDYINEDGQLLTQEQFISKIKTDDDFAKEWGELGPIYGAQWRDWTKLEPNVGQSGVNKTYIYQGYNGLHTHYLTQVDQIANLIKDLKTNPDSRRLMVSAWNPSDLPVTDYRTDDELYQDYLKDFEK
jgi:thymidylate synthase